MPKRAYTYKKCLARSREITENLYAATADLQVLRAKENLSEREEFEVDRLERGVEILLLEEKLNGVLHTMVMASLTDNTVKLAQMRALLEQLRALC